MARDSERITLVVDGAAVSAQLGQSLADALSTAGLIEARCGGAMACATCAVALVGQGWSEQDNSPSSEEEDELLDVFRSGEPQRLRLSCQLVVTPAHAGAEVEVTRLDEPSAGREPQTRGPLRR